MVRSLSVTCAALALLLAPVIGEAPAFARAKPAAQAAKPVATETYRTGSFTFALRRDSQTLARLSPTAFAAFDFTPSGRLAERQGDGFVHLGDLNLRLRTDGGQWRDFASSAKRVPVRALPAEGAVLAAADITPTMGAGLPLKIVRQWANDDGAVVLRFLLTNTSADAVEIGGLGLPMVFDNIITDRSLQQAHAKASFVDPYIGQDAGYLQVTRLNGEGPALLVLPDGRTPLEAYRPIAEAGRAPKGDLFTDRTRRAQTFEGFYDWTVASAGFLDKEWKGGGEPWNAPTSIRLSPGESRTIGVRFVLSPTIRGIEKTLVAAKRPVAIGVPGYVLPTDLDATLFLNSPQPVTKIDVHPQGALTAEPAGSVNGWARYRVKGKGWGRARLSFTYADGSVQTVSYFVTKPAADVVADLGRFSTTKQFFDDKSDPFGRAPGILTYDRDADRIVTQDHRVWIAGMSDEGGGGSWLAAIMKQLDNPDAEEVAKLERVVNETIVGKLQVADGEHIGGVKKSLFYYEPKEHPGYYDRSIDWSGWTAWSKKAAGDLGRSYNYPHVAAGHWVLYRLARNRVGLVKAHDWRWYLERAYLTTVAMMRDAPHYAQFGQMEGDIFVDILQDLKREGMTAEASNMEALMKARADHWRTLPYPFGSEMAWDSTGQPEVYAWMRYFGHQKEADVTREVILGYDPTVPHWGYNGNARRYWDFLYGGKVDRIERQIHHYGSTLNAVPLFDAFRADPSDLHLLRVAYGGLLGGITNIDREGFSSAAFHAYPDQMRFDPYSGDYGMGFFGHAYATATYLVNDPVFGWLGFGGNVSDNGGTIRIEPKDSARTRLFIAPAGLWLTLDAGKIEAADYVPSTGKVTLHLAAADAHTPAARLSIQTTTAGARPYAPAVGTLERGLYTLPLSSQPTVVELSPR